MCSMGEIFVIGGGYRIVMCFNLVFDIFGLCFRSVVFEGLRMINFFRYFFFCILSSMEYFLIEEVCVDFL